MTLSANKRMTMHKFNIKKHIKNSIALVLVSVMMANITGCSDIKSSFVSEVIRDEPLYDPLMEESTSDETEYYSMQQPAENGNDSWQNTGESSSLIQQIPSYVGTPYTIVNDNNPWFSESDMERTDAFEIYSELDNLGRCGTAYANICPELMPTESRESISEVKPSGWHNAPCDFVDGGYVYNRCHLIGFQLAGENANPLNLITGTRYMNVDGMLPFENMIDDYVDETGNHVLYRVTPVYNEDNLVASGVLMEAYSVEDNGDGILFNVYCYNVQPGCTINYATGENWIEDEVSAYQTDDGKDAISYILNTKSLKFHRADCSYAKDIGEQNRAETHQSRDDLIDAGYSPCGNCKP